MKLKYREGFWKSMGDIAQDVVDLKYIAQNEMELSPDMIAEWLCSMEKVIERLNKAKEFMENQNIT